MFVFSWNNYISKINFGIYSLLCNENNEIPKTVCVKMDCICRQFIWGSSENNRKVHLINWNKICNAKEEGGLGFRKAREVNMTCLMKLA